MKIGFCTYSLPLKWWDQTVIAHNRIFSSLVMGLHKDGHSLSVHNKVDPMTANKLSKYGVKEELSTKGLDVLFVFCGPFMPLSDKKSLTYQTLAAIREFEGRAIYVTCDYLLQFDFDAKRYGKMFADWPADSFTAGKDWKYILHGPTAHHFKTDHQLAKIRKHLPEEAFYVCELNKSGIPPNGPLPMNESPAVDLLYCGAFRAGREKFFQKYFCQPESKNWHLSTSNKNESKFRSLPGFNSRFAPPYPGGVWNYLNRSVAQIIASDDKDNNAPLPTRYWEAVSSGSVAIFDESFGNRLSELPYVPIVVSGAAKLSKEIQRLRKDKQHRKAMLSLQYSLVRDFDPMKEWGVSSWLI